MPEASSPAPSRAIPGTSKPVRGSSPAAGAADAGGVVEVEPVDVVDVPEDDEEPVPELEPEPEETGGWLLSGGPPVWLLDDCRLRVVVVVLALDVLLWLLVVVEPLPNGSVY